MSLRSARAAARSALRSARAAAVTSVSCSTWAVTSPVTPEDAGAAFVAARFFAGAAGVVPSGAVLSWTGKPTSTRAVASGGGAGARST